MNRKITPPATSAGGGTLPVLHFNVAIAGEVPPTSPHFPAIRAQIESCLSQLAELAAGYTRPQYGFALEPAVFQILLSPYHGSLALEIAQRKGWASFCVAPSPSALASWQPSSASGAARYHTMLFDMPAGSTAQAAEEAAHWMLDQSDIVIAVWDGRETFAGGHVWGIIVRAAEKGVPVIWVDAGHPDRLYWSAESGSTAFSPERLCDYVHYLLGLNARSGDADELQQLERLIVPGLGRKPLWAGFYAGFCRLFRAPAWAPTKDPLLEGPYPFPAFLAPAQAAHERLQHHFHEADEAAIAYSSYYRSSLLLRAILPFLANLALAVGFYAVTLGTYQFGHQDMWGWLAAAGFMLQASLNYSIIWLSGRNDRQGWHSSFAAQRYIAEALRLALHFAPFGIPVSSLILAAYRSRVSDGLAVQHRLRSILRAAGIPCIQYTPPIKQLFFTYLKAMLEDQIEYHKAAAGRNQRIYSTLSRAAWFLFYLGVAIVVARGLEQVVLQVLSAGRAAGYHEGLGGLLASFAGQLEQKVNDKTTRDFIISLTNMLALLMPAVAVTLHSMLSMGAFESLYRRSESMAGSLQRVLDLVTREESRPESSYEDFCRLARQIIGVMLGESTDWYALISSKKISKT